MWKSFKKGEKVAIILDVLLATTTVISALHDGARQVIPVMDPLDALVKSQELDHGGFCSGRRTKSKAG
ncbi:2-phosphosulfolactate phosphatase [Peribacillus frigoritolerans]|nr:2-phosphosulfolactate phosphatase [Peribacillus frigoritolerans]